MPIADAVNLAVGPAPGAALAAATAVKAAGEAHHHFQVTAALRGHLLGHGHVHDGNGVFGYLGGEYRMRFTIADGWRWSAPEAKLVLPRVAMEKEVERLVAETVAPAVIVNR
ncbi:MAG: hypothetical protein ACH37Z_18985 [Anaerolineae bacterium]